MSDTVTDNELGGLRVAVVGGASGIGAALASLLVRRGASAAVVDSEPSAAIPADIGNDEGCRTAIESSVAALGGLDGLAITAGVTSYAPIEETDVALWRRMLDVNLVAAGLLARYALPALEQSSNASIVVVASAAGRKGSPEFSAYSASKAGLIHWSAAAARELGPRGIRVNCVSPGPIDTPMLRGHQPAGQESTAWSERLAGRTSLGRVGKPEEVAEAIAFLLGRRASYITGGLVDVDGGETA